MTEYYKICPYCWEKIKETAKECCYCWTILNLTWENANDIKDYKSTEIQINKTSSKKFNGNWFDKNWVKSNKNQPIKNYRKPLDKSYIECLDCWFKWEWGRKRETKASDFMWIFWLIWALLMLFGEIWRKDMVICPKCKSPNVVETKLEKAS